MAFEDDFDALEQMLLAESTDYKTMREKLRVIRRLSEVARMMGPSLDRLYASVTRGHRKVFAHLETGHREEAMRESAKVIAWFNLRFRGTNLEELTKHPELAAEIKAIREIIARSDLLQDAVRTCRGDELHSE